ncbi:MAG: PEP-CTERM sorting domain-containing protein [Gammaproteobacteria bacterium]
MKTNIVKAAVLSAVLAASASASATIIYDYNRSAGTFGGNSGLSYDSVNASYNDTTEEFSFTVDYDGQAADGGWLVISPGANPKNSTDELGIAYFDALSGDAWIYAYNGENNDNSWEETPFLAYFEDAYSTIDGIATLAFDASDINAQLETGFAFGERIGIWFHPSANLTAAGDEDGLNQFTPRSNGWLDTNWDGDCNNANNGCVTAVPEPASALLFGLGIGAMGLRRRMSSRNA